MDIWFDWSLGPTFNTLTSDHIGYSLGSGFSFLPFPWAVRKLGMLDSPTDRPRVVIVGGGFGGIATARALGDVDAEIGIVDKRNYNVFQPLLYQVATAALNPSDIATPIRRIFRHQKNVNVVLGQVERVALEEQQVYVEGEPVHFDYLVLAAGCSHAYFGHPEWEQFAPGLKTIEDGSEIRRRMLLAFEAAELETDPEACRACLTFVVVGGGPTGCELAGALSETAHKSIPEDFRHVDTTTARIILIEGEGRVLPSMPEKNSADALRHLEELKVEVILNTYASDVSADGVQAGDTFIPTKNILWAAGVEASPLGKSLGVPLDRAGRVIVEPDLTVPGHPNVFVIGDQAAATSAKTGQPVPGVAQGAMQGGKYVGRLIRADIEARAAGREPPVRAAFSYFDKGSMATIGKSKAVADIFGLKIKGLIAWLAWAGIHILFLVNFRNKLAVFINWTWTYLFHDRGARLILGNNRIDLKTPPDMTRKPKPKG